MTLPIFIYPQSKFLLISLTFKQDLLFFVEKIDTYLTYLTYLHWIYTTTHNIAKSEKKGRVFANSSECPICCSTQLHAGLQLRANTSKSLSVMVTTIFGLRECPFKMPDFRVGYKASREIIRLDIRAYLDTAPNP